MSKIDISEKDLIALARLAPRVEPLPEGREIKKNIKDFSAIPITEFISTIGIQKGRNDVHNTSVYEAFLLHSNLEMSRSKFNLKFGKVIGKQKKEHYKLNMKAITLLEKVKEHKQYEKDNKED